MVIGIGCAGISAQAAGNVSDTALPTKKIEFAYSKAAQTPLRTKEDKTSHYIKNNSGFDLWVRSLSSSNVNCTLRDHAIVKVVNGLYTIKLKKMVIPVVNLILRRKSGCVRDIKRIMESGQCWKLSCGKSIV